MANNIVNEVNVFTKTNIVPGVTDGVFKNDPLLAYLKVNGIRRIQGGAYGGAMIQENFLYKPMTGRAYAPGDNFDITKRRTLEGGTFDLKHHEVNVTEFLELIEIYNRGPEAVFSLVEADLTNAALTMSAMLAIELYNGGQSTRVLNMNGLAEAISDDGVTASWDTTSYTTYGNVTRSTVTPALKSLVHNVAGPVTYKILEEDYNKQVLGGIEPNLGITTNLGMSYIKQKFHPQYRVTVQDPKIGFTGIQFNKATILQSQYCPGTLGVNDADLGNYLTSAGETFWWLVTDYIRMWVSASDMFGFGFSGFKWANDSTIVAGQYFASCNITVQSPRVMSQLYAITA
jgi:hypothetical protein